jgi:hypothetical protein
MTAPWSMTAMSGRRLVQVQHPGPADQAGGQVEAAAHASGVGLRAPPGGVGELEPRQQLHRPRPCLAAAQAEQAADHDQVVGPRQALVDGRVLAGEPDELTHLVRVPLGVVAAYPRHAAVGSQQRGEDADDGGLAGAVRAEQPEHGAGPRGQVHAGQRRRLAETLGESPRLDRVGHIFHVHDAHAAVARCQVTHERLSVRSSKHR